ncbi:hypothetical protein KPATCC21470_0844 [Kitasatospora purpeofusca]
MLPSFGTSTWAPPGDTVVAMKGGTFWDAVAVGQNVGLEALSILEGRTERRPGPVIWDSRREPRISFLVPPRSIIDTESIGCRLLSFGDYVAVPGLLVIEPPGPHWLVPPDPGQPDRLVDPVLLVSALGHADGARWATVSAGSGQLQVLVNDAQVDGRACLRCTAAELPLRPAGRGTVMSDDGVERSFDRVFCTTHLETESVSKAATE